MVGRLAFTQSDVVQAMDPEVLARGRAIDSAGDVASVETDESGSRLTGRVRGSTPRPYDQVISVRPGNNGLIFNGICSCPVHRNCKHVAAVLLQGLRRYGSAVAGVAVSGAQAVPAGKRELSPALRNWLADLADAAEARDENAYPPHLRDRLVYILDIDTAPSGEARVCVLPTATSVLKSGGYSQSAKPYQPSNIFGEHVAQHLRPIDLEILRELNWLAHGRQRARNGGIVLASDPRLLTRIIETGRCHWRSAGSAALSTGLPLRASPTWHRETNGRQRLMLRVDAGQDQPPPERFVLPFAPPHYLDPAAGMIGPLEVDMPPRLAARLAAAPEVSAGEAATLALALEQRLDAAGLKGKVPLPERTEDVETRRVTPVPRLELYLASVRLKSNMSWYVQDPRHQGRFQVPLARLTFDYDGAQIQPHDKAEMIERFEDKRVVVMPRDHRTEVAAATRLLKLGLASVGGTPLEVGATDARSYFIMPPGDMRSAYEFLNAFDDRPRFLSFSARALPELTRDGWQIAFGPGYPYQVVDDTSQWWADIGESSRIDWFSFGLGIEVEGQRISLVPFLLEVINKLPEQISQLALSDQAADQAQYLKVLSDAQLFVTLPDGRNLRLSGERTAPMLRSLLELIGPRQVEIEDGRLKVSRSEAAGIASLADSLDDVAWAASSDKLIKLGRDLKRGRKLEAVDPPKTFKADLRPYQRDGLAWLEFLRDTGFGGVLADDMGLGKTVQALAFLAREKAEGRLDKPALVIAPTSVLPNWQAEANRFAPELKVLVLRGPDRDELFGAIPNHDLVLTTYPLLMRDHEVLLKQEFHIALLDEAQAIKNPKATGTKLAHRINARHRIALTGTPLENNLGEVWSLFEYLSPGLLGDETTFRRTFRNPIEKHGDQAAQSFLTRRLKPFMLRRTKGEVAKELPPKTEIIERIRLEGGQRDLYETVRSLMHEKVRAEIAKKGMAKSHIVFLDALLKLRQVCCDPRLLSLPQAKRVKESAKIERLMEMLPEMIGEGRRILLFSQFTTMLGLIEDELKKLKIPFVQLTGDTVDRAAPVQAFQSGKVPLFLLSLKAGGTGLNLTAADTVIHYDPWWNPAVESQATDRAYRIGQDKPVFVYRLIVEEGIEEAIELLKVRKAALAEALFEGASKAGLALTEQDISALFAPLDRRPGRKAA